MEVEIGILEAKVENAQPVLEARDLQYAMEKQVLINLFITWFIKS